MDESCHAALIRTASNSFLKPRLSTPWPALRKRHGRICGKHFGKAIRRRKPEENRSSEASRAVLNLPKHRILFTGDGALAAVCFASGAQKSLDKRRSWVCHLNQLKWIRNYSKVFPQVNEGPAGESSPLKERIHERVLCRTCRDSSQWTQFSHRSSPSDGDVHRIRHMLRGTSQRHDYTKRDFTGYAGHTAVYCDRFRLRQHRSNLASEWSQWREPHQWAGLNDDFGFG